MTDKQLATTVSKKNAIQSLASRLQVDVTTLQSTLKQTAFRECKTNEEFISAVIVANTYGLNPLLKEIYAFPSSRGGVIPILSIDGWISLVNRQPNFNGCELIENNDDKGELISVTAKFYLKDKDYPIVVTEYLSECYDDSKTPWKRWKRRMLRHKAYIQGARVAFGFSGVYDEDEAQRIIETQAIEEGNAKPAVIEPKQIVKEPDNKPEEVNEHLDDIQEEIEEEITETKPIEKTVMKGRPATEAQQKAIHSVCSLLKKQGKFSDEQLYNLLTVKYKIDSTKDLTTQQASEVISELQKKC